MLFLPQVFKIILKISSSDATFYQTVGAWTQVIGHVKQDIIQTQGPAPSTSDLK